MSISKNHLVLAFLLAVSAPTVGSALAQESLFFQVAAAPGHDEHTVSGSSGTVLHRLRGEDTAIVTPDPGLQYSAETYLSHQNWNTLAGDHDCDGTVFQDPLSSGIDALVVCDPFGKDADRNHNLFMSVADDIPGTPSLPLIREGDVFSYRSGGGVAVMLGEDQIRSVFGIPPGQPCDVDAVAMDPLRNIYLSLEHTVTLNLSAGSITVEDGAVLVIPHDLLSWDGCVVSDTAPNTGGVLYTEGDMDAMVAASGLGAPDGSAVLAVGDVDGLDPIRALPTKIMQVFGYGNLEVYELRFTGLALHGGAVLSTESGGAIAVMNGVPLANAAPSPTDGSRVGLVPAGVLGLNGIASIEKPSPTRLTLDTDDNAIVPGGTLTLDVGGADPSSPVLIGMAAYTGACAAPASVPVSGPGHAYYFSPVVWMPILTSDAAGFATTGSLPIPPGAAPGIELVFQAITPKGPFGVPGLTGAVTLRF